MTVNEQVNVSNSEGVSEEDAESQAQSNENVGETPDVPWTEETYDAERAGKLIANLRAERDEWQEKARSAESSKVAKLEAVIQQMSAEMNQMKQEAADAENARTKERLLAERGLPLTLVEALPGDSEEKWVEFADLFKSMRGAGGTNANVPVDPVQSEAKREISSDAARLALAKKMFGNS